MTNAIVKAEPDEGALRILWKESQIALKSGMLPAKTTYSFGYTSPEQLMYVALKGREMGLGFFESIDGIHIIKGKPTMSSELMAKLVYRAGHHLRVITESPDECVVEFRRRDWPDSSTFTLTRSEVNAAGYTTGKKIWDQIPGRMLARRAVSMVCKMHFPDAISGVYTPEEIDPGSVHLGEHGEVLVVPATNGTHAPQQRAVDTETGEIIDDAEFRARAGDDAPTIDAGVTVTTDEEDDLGDASMEDFMSDAAIAATTEPVMTEPTPMTQAPTLMTQGRTDDKPVTAGQMRAIASLAGLLDERVPDMEGWSYDDGVKQIRGMNAHLKNRQAANR